jgi:hypothetical protein
MNRCEINLGRFWILPEKTRRRVFRAMQIYLVAAGLLTVLAFYHAALNLRRAADCRSEARMIREQFSLTPPGRYSLLHYANRLQTRIESCEKQTGSILEVLPSALCSSLPALNYLVAPYGDSTLKSFIFIQEENNRQPLLEFSLTVPAEGRKSPGSSRLQNWQNSPELGGCFASITPVTTRLGNFEENNVFVVNYKAVFKESL